MKWCPYCGAGHSNRGRACCPEHAKRQRSFAASQAAGRRRAQLRSMQQLRAGLEHAQRWRDVAMGRDAQANLDAIFKRRRS